MSAFDRKFPTRRNVLDVEIAINTAVSGTISLGVGLRTLLGVLMPAGWTAASMTFAVSVDDSTYVPLHYRGEEYEITAAGGAAAGLAVTIDPAAIAGWPYVRIRSGTAGTPVNQLAKRSFQVLTRVV